MNRELRFHVVSLCAVFLALGIGILIGTTFVGNRIVDRQSGLIARLEGRVEFLRRDAVENGRVAEALELVAPTMNKGTLSGLRVVVVDAADDPGTADVVSEQLQAAGADCGLLRLSGERWGSEIQADAAAARLGYALHRGEDLSSLLERGLVSGEGKGAFQRLVMVTGGAAGTGDSDRVGVLWGRLEECAQAFRDAGGTVLVVERTDAEQSLLPAARRRGFNTVDCAEHPAGWIALVRLLKLPSNQDGVAYGLRDDATRRMPIGE